MRRLSHRAAKAVGAARESVGAAIARHFSVKYSLSHLETTVLVLVANVMSFAIFWVLKLLAFNKLFHHQVELEEFDEHLIQEEEEQEEESAHSGQV